MPVSGLLITYADDDALRGEALRALRAERRLELGEREGLRQAAVLDAATAVEDRTVWDWIRARPGVAAVDVVFIAFDDDRAAGDPAPPNPPADASSPGMTP